MAPSTRPTKSDAEKKNAKAKPAPHIQDLSFTHAGRAFQHPEGFDDGPVFLNAKGFVGKPYKKVLTVAPPENHAKSRLAISLTEKEMQLDPPPGLHKYLLVGWVPQNSTGTTVTKPKHGAVVGNERPPADNIITFDPEDENSLPLMAVVDLTEDETERSTTTLVLLRQHNGICTPYTGNADEVYYLSLFRDNSTAMHDRKANWNRMVSRHSLRANTNTPTVKQTLLRRAHDQAKLVLPPTTSLKNEIGALIAAYELSNDQWCLDQMTELIEDADSNLVMTLPENTALHAFPTLGNDSEAERFTETDAKKVVDETHIAWPDAELDVWHVRVLGRAMQLQQRNFAPCSLPSTRIM